MCDVYRVEPSSARSGVEFEFWNFIRISFVIGGWEEEGGLCCIYLWSCAIINFKFFFKRNFWKYNAKDRALIIEYRSSRLYRRLYKLSFLRHVLHEEKMVNIIKENSVLSLARYCLNLPARCLGPESGLSVPSSSSTAREIFPRTCRSPRTVGPRDS